MPRPCAGRGAEDGQCQDRLVAGSRRLHGGNASDPGRPAGADPMTATLASDEVRPVEDRAQVASLGDLQQRRRTLLSTLAPLKALHGHNGIWDDKRKQLLEACKIRARMSLADAGQKATEAMV